MTSLKLSVAACQKHAKPFSWLLVCLWTRIPTRDFIYETIRNSGHIKWMSDLWRNILCANCVDLQRTVRSVFMAVRRQVLVGRNTISTFHPSLNTKSQTELLCRTKPKICRVCNKRILRIFCFLHIFKLST